MAPLPRRLHVAVGTGLLGASLSFGCTDKDVRVNEGPEKKTTEPPSEKRVNEGPEPAPKPEPQPQPTPTTAPPEPIHVNEGPQPEPEPAPEKPPQELKVNPGPIDDTALPPKTVEG